MYRTSIEMAKKNWEVQTNATNEFLSQIFLEQPILMRMTILPWYPSPKDLTCRIAREMTLWQD